MLVLRSAYISQSLVAMKTDFLPSIQRFKSSTMADNKTAVSPSDRARSPQPSVRAADMNNTRDVPRWKYIWHHSLTQMILLSIQAFCGPAMSDAIAGQSLRSRLQRTVTDFF